MERDLREYIGTLLERAYKEGRDTHGELLEDAYDRGYKVGYKDRELELELCQLRK